MNRTPLIPLVLAAALFLSSPASAATLYHYNFDNGTSGTWTPADTSWMVCKTVATGTPEYCQTDTTAQFATTAFDGDVTWSDYSVQADVKLDNYLSGEIGIIGRAQDATHYYQLSLKSEPTTGARMWWISRIEGGGRDRDRVRQPVFPERLLLSNQAHVLQAIHPGVILQRWRAHVRHAGLCRGHAIRDGKIGLMTSNTKGVFDNVSREHVGRAEHPALRARRDHDARESELHRASSATRTCRI